MSETAVQPEGLPAGEFWTPEKEQAEKGDFVPDPYDIPLEEINPLNAHMFEQHRWHDYFKRLRVEDPVHFKIKRVRPFWLFLHGSSTVCQNQST